ncbi:MAG: hypothetical protein K1X75_02940 [Leptospirales bacterium]|nr:hypothetical protein [Leptospirales bacterium]
MDIQDVKRVFYEAVADRVDQWTSLAANLRLNANTGWLEDPARFGKIAHFLGDEKLKSEFEVYIGEILNMAVHSIFVIIDNGSGDTPDLQLNLVEKSAGSFNGNLHEEYIEHLFATRRMK